jgi:hypothetical protein
MISALIKLEVHEDGTMEAEVKGKSEDIAAALILLCAEKEEMSTIIKVCAKYLEANGEELINQFKQMKDEESTESAS